ncbi:Zn(II)2Cys6 transcription factor [Lecanosticta acicola]|uniref:Zn(II)2Cys6 transcription factor n=1 Tax=Lecanosticta acicola TaxID=111012 RepID=A0AAI8Z116_9PEZI|nr:Zn(II)2Cys6 transcription factor [Lecanosticta acicola]
MADHKQANDGRVRKRASNACERCRRQKIKCSGTQKILVTQSYIAELERRAGVAKNGDSRAHDNGIDVDEDSHALNGQGSDAEPATPRDNSPTPSEAGFDADPSESEHSNHNGLRSEPVAGLTNPLDPVNSDAFTVNNSARRYCFNANLSEQDFLGVSSNWSFGRRVLSLVHIKVNGAPPPTGSLLFEGATYDLGWDGHRTSSTSVDTSGLPTADFALFLINAVKFHCGRLFHMFDEAAFMHYFSIYYEDPGNESNYPRLWYIHFLLVLAFGKAFIVRAAKGKRPPGADLFVQAMQLLPDITCLYTDAMQSIEILCCTALYLQCLDYRSAAYNTIGQAMRMAVEQGMYTDMRSLHLSEPVVERCRAIWWTVYVLDRQMTAMMGVPMSLSDDDITAPLPSFSGSAKKQLAMGLHVELAKANAVILQTVYGKTGGRSERFLSSMKDALRTIAQANDERNNSFPLQLESPASGVCRLSAYLHLFHHQALILATRPLLFSFLQKRLETHKSLRVSSSRGGRSLLRVCVGSAQQCLNILETLQSQSLLESFVPFDREAAFSAALVLTIATHVDPSLVKDSDPRLETASSILDEMASRGNLIAEHQRQELEQLASILSKSREMANALRESQQQGQLNTPGSTESYAIAPSEGMIGMNEQMPGDNFDSIGTLLSEWNSEDGLSGEHLMAVADSLDFGQLNWPAMGDIDTGEAWI